MFFTSLWRLLLMFSNSCQRQKYFKYNSFFLQAGLIELIEQCCLGSTASVLAGRTCKNHILRPGDNNPVVHGAVGCTSPLLAALQCQHLGAMPAA